MPCLLAHSPELAVFMLIVCLALLIFPCAFLAGVSLPPLLLLRPNGAKPSALRRGMAWFINTLGFAYSLLIGGMVGQFHMNDSDKPEPLDSLPLMLIIALLFIGAEYLVYRLRRRILERRWQNTLPPTP